MRSKSLIAKSGKFLLLAVIGLIMLIKPLSASEENVQSDPLYEQLISETDSLDIIPQEYTVEPGLANVANLQQFAEELTPAQIEFLESNYFVVSPTDLEQLFYIYEKNTYNRPDKIPSFITTDSILHTYHFFFDYVLRTLEENKFSGILSELSQGMLRASLEDYNVADDENAKDAALRNAAYFAVACNLLDGTPPPDLVAEMANADLAKIESHDGRFDSRVTTVLIDFTQFVPRGHYTRSEELSRYFKAMMWYGLVGLPLKSENFNNYVPTRIALVMAKNLARYEIDGAPASELWERIYEPTVFFVGKSDDFSFNDYWPIIEEVFGSYPHVNKFGDNALIDEFLEQVKSLPGPGIEQYVPVTEEGGFVKGARQFRFMGQRFIPDSRIIQELVHNSVENRLVPSGLDVFSALGSDRAVEIMEEYYGTGNFPDYAPQMAAMREEVNNYDLARWQSNLYFGWIWSLNSIIAVPDEWQPSFMQNQAWLDKSLFTAMGSWTELRHDTILYGKQSGAECGGDYEEPPAQPRGYVEPNIDFWNKMLWLIRYTQNGLNDSGLADAVLNKQYEWMPDANLNDRFDWLAEIVEGCRTITIKELTGEQLTMEDYEFIEFYGSRLEGLYLTLAEGPILSEDDRDMAIVADVHNIGDTVLEEGIGHAAAIYVIVPVEGKLVITRGAVFTQYEFLHPAADRLTNEKWREWLQNGEEPPFAGWTESFMVYSDNFPTFEHVDSAC